MRAIDADALMADCQLAQKQASRHGREFANAFYSGGGEISTEWWCVEDMIENAPTIEPERKPGKWIVTSKFEDCRYVKCNQCKVTQVFYYNKPLTNFCPNCGSDMRGEEDEHSD